MDEYKAASYGLGRVVKDAKRRYRDRVEVQMEQRNTRCLSQGLQTTDHPGRSPSTVSTEASLCSDRGEQQQRSRRVPTAYLDEY